MAKRMALVDRLNSQVDGVLQAGASLAVASGALEHEPEKYAASVGAQLALLERHLCRTGEALCDLVREIGEEPGNLDG